jgi:peptidoglycan hydrolase-like protein with peptidoglycan-binding domain
MLGSATTLTNSLWGSTSAPAPTVVKAPVAAHPTLKSGSTRSALKTAQADLNNFHYGLKVDGVFGPATRAAVVAFQKSHGLVADGIIGPATWAKLAPAASVQPVAALTYTVWAGHPEHGRCTPHDHRVLQGARLHIRGAVMKWVLLFK